MKEQIEFEKWYETARNDEDEQLEFTWAIAASPYTEYYYRIMTDKSTGEKFRYYLWSRFDDHGKNAAELMLSKLDGSEDAEFHPRIIFCLGKIADERKIEKERTLEYARKFAGEADNRLRDRAIIVLGWIGGVKDIPLLGEHLLNDPDAKCRAWSASSFMQMYFRRKSQQLLDRALPLLKQTIARETDYFALGCMINVVAQLSGKKFGLPQYAIDNADGEKIDTAKVKVERYLKKLYGE